MPRDVKITVEELVSFGLVYPLMPIAVIVSLGSRLERLFLILSSDTIIWTWAWHCFNDDSKQ